MLFPGAIFRLPGNGPKKRVFLTFDDGPIPQITPWVLDMLDRYGIKATFFMVGQNIERYPDILEDIKRRGHATGNHTLHHMKGGFGSSSKEYLKDSHEGARLSESSLFRPPHGWLSPFKLSQIKKHYSVVMYDLVTRDYSRFLNSDEVIGNVKKFTRDGSIIVFHDSLKSWDRLERALPKSIEWLLQEGYEFELLSPKIINQISASNHP